MFDVFLPIFGQSKCFPNYDMQKCVMMETFDLLASTVIGKYVLNDFYDI